MKEKRESKATLTFFIMMGMSTAFLLVTPVLILLAVGFFADNFFHTTPFYMALGVCVGLLGGVMNVFKLLQAMQKRKKQTSDSSSRT